MSGREADLGGTTRGTTHSPSHGESQLLDLLAGAVRAAREAGADDAEASFAGGTLGVSRFANSTLTQAGVIEEGALRVRVAYGTRVGSACAEEATPAAALTAVRRASELARHQPPGPFAGFARPDLTRPLRGAPAWHDATAACSPAERAALLARVFARAARNDLECAGSLATGSCATAVVTAAGITRHRLVSEATLTLIASDAAASGYAAHHGPSLAGIDLDELADSASTTAVRARDPLDLAPEPLDVILSPAAVAEALEWICFTSLTGRALGDGISLLAGRKGAPLVSPLVTLLDDPGYAHPQAVPSPFDAEGTARLPVTFFHRGVGGDVVTDSQTALELCDPRGSTGHAPPVVGDLSDGPAAENVVLLPGGDTLADLVARVDRGLLVTRFHYVNGFLDPRRATMTGMTRDGTFLIEGGRIGRAVRNLRFTDSFLDALSEERLAGVGRDLAATPTSWTSSGAILCPALLIRGFCFTGRSR